MTQSEIILNAIEDLESKVQGILSDRVQAVRLLAAQIQDPLPIDIVRPPMQPTDLKARLLDESTVVCELVWTHVHTAGEDIEFIVERESNIEDSLADWQQLAVIQGDVSTYEDNWYDKTDHPYAYRVRSRNRAGLLSEWSNTADPEKFIIEPSEPDPSTGRQTVQPGFNFSGKKGAYFLKAGKYNITIDPESDLDLRGESRDAVILTIDSGKQFLHRGATRCSFNDLTFDGQKKAGASDRLNDKAMIVPGDQWYFRNVRITGAIGVGCGCDGSRTRFYNVEVDNNGSAGIGGKADSSILYKVHAHHNNIIVKDRDGGVLGKFTRTNGQLFIDCLVEIGTCAGIWHDINNSNIAFLRVIVRQISLASSSRGWTAAGMKAEIPTSGSTAPDILISLAQEQTVLRAAESLDGFTAVELKTWNFIYKNCSITDTYAYCIDWNECTDIFWDGGELGEGKDSADGTSVGVRDLRRSDAGSEKDNWQLRNILIRGVKATTGTLSISGSGAGNKVSRDGNKIKVEGVQGNVKWLKIN